LTSTSSRRSTPIPDPIRDVGGDPSTCRVLFAAGRSDPAALA
jgi:hypothetical protein